MNGPNQYQLSALEEAIPFLSATDFAPYLTLKCLLAERRPGFQVEFRPVFEHYYGMNAGGVTPAFKDRFFDLLFGLNLQPGVDPYSPILKELYNLPRRKGDQALQCSFVSKLVAMHDETYPIFDRHVSNFFGVSAPAIGSLDFRIAGFVANVKWLRETYQRWAENSRFQKVLSCAAQKHPQLHDCAPHRVADLLVWTVGRKKLGSKAREFQA